jgi:HlyD family secretion protein
MKLIQKVLIMLALVLLGACQTSDSGEISDPVRASGFIEGQVTRIASLSGGLIEEVLISEGEAISADQAVIQLDSQELQSVHTQAVAGLAAAEAALALLENQPTSAVIAAAEAGVNSARAGLNEASAGLKLLIASYDPFDPPDQEQHAAEAGFELAKTAVFLAKAQQEQLLAGANEGELRAAKAAVREAEANLALVDYQMEKMTLQSPINGQIGAVLIRKGMLALPGATLIEVFDPNVLTLTVYIPEQRMAQISPGDVVSISVDSYPDKFFSGRVQRIADQAQFTPTSVQTMEERVKLVFAVELLLEDHGGLLLPGMPADAAFIP